MTPESYAVQIEYEPFDLFDSDIADEINEIVPVGDNSPDALVKYLFEHENNKHIILGQLCAQKRFELVTNCFGKLIEEPIDLTMDFSNHNFAILMFHIFHVSGRSFQVASEVTSKLIECYVRGVNHLPMNAKLNNDQLANYNYHVKPLRQYGFDALQSEGHTYASVN